MAGHSKWANIKHRKKSKDSQKAKSYTKLLSQIAAASKEGGPIPENNIRLRLAIQNAKAANLPKEKICHAIESNKDHKDYTETIYEGYAPHGVATIVITLSNNINRTVAELRSTFFKHRGNLATKGSVQHLFTHSGIFHLQTPPQEATQLALIEAGAETFEQHQQHYTITCSVNNFHNVQKTLEQHRLQPLQAKQAYLPNSLQALPKQQATQVQNMMEALGALPDVLIVYHNLSPTPTP